MKRIFYILPLFMIVFLASSCNDNDFYGVNIQKPASDRVEKMNRSSANILWVIDDSGSMSNHNANVKKNAQALNGILRDNGISFTMATVTTGEDHPNFGKFRGDPTVLTPAVHNWETLFEKRVPGTDGDYVEKPFGAVMEAFSPANIADGHSGFIEEDGYLILIIVTDSEDRTNSKSSSLYVEPEEFVDFLTQYYPLQRIFYFGILCITDKVCDLDWDKGGPNQNRVHQLSQHLNSRVFAISETDYSPFFEDIGDMIVKLLSRFPLQSVPLIETLRVFVNGAEIPNDPYEGWTYDTDRVEIIFNGKTLPKQSDDIRVKYTPIVMKKK